MVVKEDGSKWACQSCLKGHRVSGCTHTDRELTLVPKKGRPVTQCQHCRLERKKRSAHVKCDCGETDKPHHPKEKCIHLREAEERAKAGYHDDHTAERDPVHLAAVAEEQGCCCHHGGQCSCAILKKETDDNASAPHGPAVKPRLEKATSEGALTVFTNGHHKPVHRKNHAAHESGVPYKMPVPRSNPDENVSPSFHRSVDSLALDNTMPYQPSAFTPQTSAPFNTERRRSKSEQPSPRIPAMTGTCSGLGDAKLTSIDFSNLAPTQSSSSAHSAMSDNYFPVVDPMSGVTDNSFDPWSAFPSGDSNSMPGSDPFGVWPGSIDSNSMVQPPLTAASSGTQSDIDEMPPMDDVYTMPMHSIQENADAFNIPNMSTENLAQSNRKSLPPGFFGSGSIGNDWLGPVGDFNLPVESKSPNAAYDNTWQMPGLTPMQSVPQRAVGGSPFASRPQSRSVGSTSSPGDDIIKSLFPEMDLSNGGYGPSDSPELTHLRMDRTMGGMPSSSAPTSAPANFGRVDENVGFTSQPWSDGSMSVPNDPYTDSFNLDQDYSNPQFNNNWQQ